MKVSFKGIGERLVTFLSDGAENGQVVKVTAAGTVGPCADGERFEGVALYTEGDYASVRLGGFVTAKYSGTAPGVGRVQLCADGSGGVKLDTGSAGGSYLAVDVDSAASTVTFLM